MGYRSPAGYRSSYTLNAGPVLLPPILSVPIDNVTWSGDTGDPLVSIVCNTEYNPAFHVIAGCSGPDPGVFSNFEFAAGAGQGNEDLTASEMPLVSDGDNTVSFYADLYGPGDTTNVGAYLEVILGNPIIVKDDWGVTHDIGYQLFGGNVSFSFYGVISSGVTYGVCVSLPANNKCTGVITSQDPSHILTLIAWDRTNPGVETVLLGPSTGSLTLTNFINTAAARLVLKITRPTTSTQQGVIRAVGTIAPS